ncbi:MAG: hypothetical protein LGR52_03380 [Candidatus Thiosymbion ectosymbiont of Robbea hypermnestra]|nr:hypothetical protein [Candidatus Thiosymbion ectosymbiont of Robbea hypermnestra]
MNLVAKTTKFFDSYLNPDVGPREHISLLFTDLNLPDWFMDGLEKVKGTKWKLVDTRTIESQRAVLEEFWNPKTRYISVHDYTAHGFFGAGQSAVKFAEVNDGIDYTSFEFPRFGLTAEQIEVLLRRYVSGDPHEHMGHVDAFFALLNNNPRYSIAFQTGPNHDHALAVTGPGPWMELAGPLCEGNMRFAPGAEIFYHGRDVSGELYCSEGINLLPLRSNDPQKDLCEQFLRLGHLIREDPLILSIEASSLVDYSSARGKSAQLFKQLSDTDAAFFHLVEVGIGMSHAASPLIHDWAATSNEAVPGVHIGIGADPANTGRFKTNVHVDFVCPTARILVNGKPFYDGKTFVGPASTAEAP